MLTANKAKKDRKNRFRVAPTNKNSSHSRAGEGLPAAQEGKTVILFLLQSDTVAHENASNCFLDVFPHAGGSGVPPPPLLFTETGCSLVRQKDH